MIKVTIKEQVEGDLAVRTIEVSFLCIVVFRYKKTSTSGKAIAQLSKIKKNKIGYETEDKSKKNK